jgi:hypothetical protein
MHLNMIPTSDYSMVEEESDSSISDLGSDSGGNEDIELALAEEDVEAWKAYQDHVSGNSAIF